MAWTHESKKSIVSSRQSGVLAGLDDIVGSLGERDKKFYELEVAEVLDICLDSKHDAFAALGGYSNGAIGRVQIRLLHSESIRQVGDFSNGELGGTIWARPLFSNIKAYPLISMHIHA